MDNHENSELVAAHLPCPDCGSSDALSEYSDGHSFCFACNTRHGGNRRPKDFDKMVAEHATVKAGGLRSGEVRELKARMISRETCEAFQYLVGPACQIAQYFDASGNVIAQKVRNPDKTFAWYGDAKRAGFFGKHLWKGCSNSVLVVTEGEVDTLSIYEVTKGMMPVVSVQNGAQSAAKTFKADLEWVSSFESVILCFDNDEHGVAAAKECAAILAPGKAKLCELPLKDANDMLKAGRSTDLYTALKAAKPYRPDGIVSGKDIGIRARAKRPTPFATYPWDFANEAIGGIYPGDLVIIGAASGAGKTSFMAEIAYHLAMNGTGVGVMFMEETVEETGLRFHGMYLNKSLFNGEHEVSDEEHEEACVNTTDKDTFHIYEHQGESDVDRTLEKMRYLIHVHNVRVIFLDNLSTIIAGLSDNDERRGIDKLMRGVYQFAQREGVAIFMASHLTKPIGQKGYDNGLEINQGAYRGSGAISSNATLLLGLERDIYSDEPTRFRIVKSRKYGAKTGVRGYLKLDTATGRLREAGGSPFTPATSSREPNSDF